MNHPFLLYAILAAVFVWFARLWYRKHHSHHEGFDDYEDYDGYDKYGFPEIPHENYRNPDVIEHYRLKGNPWWADAMKLKVRDGGRLLVDSFGRASVNPAYYPVGSGWGGGYRLRGGRFVPGPDYRYMRRAALGRGRWDPLRWSLLNNYYYPQYPGLGGVRLY